MLQSREAREAREALVLDAVIAEGAMKKAVKEEILTDQ